MADNRAEFVIPERLAAGRKYRKSGVAGSNLTKDLKLANKLLWPAAGVTLAASLIDRQPQVSVGDLAKNLVGQTAHHRVAKENVGQRYPELVDPRDKIPDRSILPHPNLTEEQQKKHQIQLDNEREIIRNNYLGEIELINIRAWEPLIRESARAEGVPEELMLGLVIFESKGYQFAVSKVGAKGLMQMMPDKAKECGLIVSDLNTSAEIILQ